MAVAVNIWTTVAVACVPAAAALIASLVAVHAAQPKTDAEADLAQANANAANIATQGNVIVRLDAEVKRLEIRLHKTEKALASTGEALEGLRKHARLLESSLDDAHEQNEMLATQLADSEADRKVLLQQNTILVEQNRILVEQNRTLTETLRLVAKWLRDTYTSAGFPEGADPPPDLTQFLTP